MAFKASNERFDLVTEDYYEKEVYHDTLMQKKLAYKTLDEEVKHYIHETDLCIAFPSIFVKKIIKGNLYLYKASDERLDRHYSIELHGDLIYKVPLAELSKGLYELQLDWEVENDSYFMSNRINL